MKTDCTPWLQVASMTRFFSSVIPGLTRNPVVILWIPVFTGMTELKTVS